MSSGDLLPIETYALALAHLLRRRAEPAAVVLESLKLSEDDLRRAERHYDPELAQCLDRRKGVLAMRFASALGEALERLDEVEPPAVVPPGPPPAPPPAQPLVPSYRLEDGPAPGHASWQPTPLVVTPRPPSEDVAGTADISAFVPRSPLPFAQPAAPPLVPPPAATPEPRHDGSGTADVTSFVAQAATPFGDPPAPHAPGEAPDHPRMRLVRFDPQTGQPLAEPRWEQVPPEAIKR